MIDPIYPTVRFALDLDKSTHSLTCNCRWDQDKLHYHVFAVNFYLIHVTGVRYM